MAEIEIAQQDTKMGHIFTYGRASDQGGHPWQGPGADPQENILNELEIGIEAEGLTIDETFFAKGLITRPGTRRPYPFISTCGGTT